MSIFHTPLDKINEKTLIELLNLVPEGRQLDYKRELNFDKSDQKRELYKDVASFATASGGDIIYGIDENDDSTPRILKPMNFDNFDSLKLSIVQGIRSNVFPRINFQIQEIKCESGLAVIIRVIKSFQGPVALKDNDTYRFYSRNSTGNYPLDYLEIKNSFLQSNSVSEQFHNFRNQRIDYFLSGERGNNPTNPFFLFYIYPMYDTNFNINIVPEAKLIELLFPVRTGGGDFSYDIEGFAMFNHSVEENKNLLTQNQLFYNGSIEIYDDRILNIKVDPKTTSTLMYLHMIEDKIIDNYSNILKFYNEQSIFSPYICSLSIINVKEAIPVLDNRYGDPFDFKKIKKNNLIFRDFIIDGSININDSLKPIFDDMWRACGVSKSNSYSDSGIFIRHRF